MEIIIIIIAKQSCSQPANYSRGVSNPVTVRLFIRIELVVVDCIDVLC